MGLIWFALMLVLGLFQLAAFQAGLHEWWGLNSVMSVIIGVVALMMGPMGGLAVAVVGFFGAMQAWDWEWWQAGLLCFPSIALTIIMAMIGGTASLGSLILNRKQS